jgi:hypothetical protein
MKWLQLRNDDSEVILLKSALDDDTFIKTQVIWMGAQMPLNSLELKAAYQVLVLNAAQKYSALIDLCDFGVIRSEYQPL